MYPQPKRLIPLVSVMLIVIRSFNVTMVGLKTTQIFFRQILHSLLHARIKISVIMDISEISVDILTNILIKRKLTKIL